MASGSTRVNATYTTSGSVGDYIQFSWQSSGSSVSGNYTDVSWKLILYSLSNGLISSSASKNWSVKVNGTSYSGTNTIGIGNNTSKTLASGSTRIAHNSDGTKTFSYSFSQTFNITFNNWVGTVSGSGNGTLDTIPRYAKISSYTISDTSQTSISYSWKADSVCSKISCYLNGKLQGNSAINASSGTYTINGLKPGTAYSVYFVITRKDSGLTTQSETKSVTTRPIASLSPDQTFSFHIGNDLPLSLQDYSMNASTLKLSVENDAGEWISDVDVITVPAGTASCIWELSALAETLYTYCKTKNRMNIRISCGVTLDGTYYENIYTGTAEVTDSNPVLESFLLTNTDSAIASLLGTNKSVERYGNFQVQIPVSQKAVAQNSAEIIKYAAYLAPYASESTIIRSAESAYSADSQVNIDLGTHSASGTYLICVYAVDSRGNVSETLKTPCTIYPYHIPVPSIFLQRMNGFENTIFLSISVLYSRLLANAVPQNSITSLAYRFTKAGTAQPESWTPITDFSSAILDTENARITYYRNTIDSPFMELSNEFSYDFEFRIMDEIQAIVIHAVVEQGIPIIGEFDDGHITVGMLPDMSDTAKLQVNSDILAKDGLGNLRKVFETLSNMISLSDTEPSEQTLGGLWLEDVTETYTNGG